MAMRGMVEKFTSTELVNLRNELLQAGIDSWQAAQVVSGFLAGRGYGTDSERLGTAVTRIEGSAGNLNRMQEELEKIAFFM